jgi:hypothetical protein
MAPDRVQVLKNLKDASVRLEAAAAKDRQSMRHQELQDSAHQRRVVEFRMGAVSNQCQIRPS